ncbi:MAG TPA: hypothetical protein VHJ76_02760 [Actinomycetota bacterium]|nr:hypothetical protein [Actinomycetota bacterium]
MRRTIGLLCAAMVLLAPAGASAGPPPELQPGLVAEEGAMASWMFPTERPSHSRWFFAGAYRNATAGGRTITTGFAVKGRCHVTHENGSRVTTCHGKGIGGDLPESAFQADPALREARLVLRDGRDRHTLEWKADAEAPPSGYIAGEACDEGAGEGGGFMQHAMASGNVFERRLGPRGVDHAMLSRGAMLTECTSIEALARRAAAGEVVTLVFR